MAQQTVSSNGVTATLWAVVEEIDDDDEDILEVTIDVSNESSRDLWDISGDIRSMDGTHARPLSKPSRIESGDDNQLTFWVPAETAAWLFKIDYNTDSGRGTIELGPFANDLRIAAVAKPDRIVKPAQTSKASVIAKVSDPLAAAFGDAMDGFGDEDDVAVATNLPVAESEDPMQAAFAGGIIESQEPIVNQPESSPPTGPPSSPPSGPAAGPPSSPPSGPPTGPPSSPPSGPPTGPPSSPPSGPPTGPPSGRPTGAPPGPPPSSSKPPGPPPS